MSFNILRAIHTDMKDDPHMIINELIHKYSS